MKTFILTALFSIHSLAAEVIWSAQNEAAIEQSTLELAKRFPLQTAIVGRTGIADTQVAVVIGEEGHLLSPYLPSIDGEDAPYLLYKQDGSRIQLTTVAEKPKRFLSLLKLPEKDPALLPTKIARLIDHTLALPTCAPIANLGETPGIYLEHLEFPPPEDADAVRLDGIFHHPGTPVFDLAGSLVAITLKPRRTNTPALLIERVLAEFPELDEIAPDESVSGLPNLPLAPQATPEEIKEQTDSPLTTARERFVQATHPNPLPCALVFNENAQATHSVIGTIVREDGLILTKASDLGPDLRIRVGGQNYPGVLLSTDEKSDLALVGIEANGLPVIRWSNELPQPGATVAAPVLLQESTENMVAEPTSYLGTFVQLLKEGTPTVQTTSKVTSLGLVTEQIESKVVIAAIFEEAPAFESGLSPGDVIDKINGNEITLRSELSALLDSRKVGDKVTIEITRGGEAKKYEVSLTSPLIIPPTTGIEITRGIPMIPSVRRGPFPDVLVHTAPLNAWDCGSPLFDLQGRALGLNIAAMSATRTVALTPAAVRAALERLLAETRAF